MTEAAAYFPDDLCDEVMPADRPTPSAWVIVKDGAPYFDTAECYEHDVILADGQVVKFSRRFDYGCASLSITEGNGIIVDRPMPAEADLCCLLNGLQAETLAENVEEMIKIIDGLGLPPDTYDVSYYRFESGLPFRFDAATQRFAPVNG